MSRSTYYIHKLLLPLLLGLSLVLMMTKIWAAPIPVVLYEDKKVTIYDDNPNSGASKELSVVHNAGLDDELFAVTLSQRRDQYGREQTYYEYSYSIIEDFRKKLPELYGGQINHVTLRHFVKGHSLPPHKATNPNSRGRPVAQFILTNEGYNSAFRSWNNQWGRTVATGLNVEANWRFYYPGTDQPDAILRSFLNTFNKAANWGDESERILNQMASEQVNAEQPLPQSTSAEEFGYNKYKLLLKDKTTEYFVVESEFSGILKLVAVHAIGPQDAVVDLDIFPIPHSLGFYFSDAAVDSFNQQLAPAIHKISTSARNIWIYHYVKGHPLPIQPSNSFESTPAKYPVFVSNYYPKKGSIDWQPEYDIKRPNSRAPGNFAAFRTRYSYASTLAFIKEYNISRNQGRAAAKAKPWNFEADEAYRHAIPAAQARRSKYDLWTEGYWQFANFELGRNLIDGLFDRIPRDENFTFFYMTFLQQYSNACKANISSPSSFRHTKTREHSDGYGNKWSETLSDTITYMEPRFAANYESYYYNRPPEATKEKRNLNQFFEDLASIKYFINLEGCTSPVMTRLKENLYLRSQSMAALTTN